MGESDVSDIVRLVTSQFATVNGNLVTMNNAIANVNAAVQNSRTERETQMRELREDIGGVKQAINHVTTEGCAHRAAHEASYRRSQEDIAYALKEVQELRKAVVRRDASLPTFSDMLGTLDWTNKRVTGLAAVLVAVAVGFVVFKYWDRPATKDTIKAIVTHVVQ